MPCLTDNKPSDLAVPVIAISLLLAPLLPLAAQAQAQTCRQVGGTIDATIVGGDPVNVLGSVKGDLAGATRAILTSRTEAEGGSVRLGLTHDFVTNDRNTLKTTDTAVWTPVPGRAGVFHMATQYEIVGGSGDYENASGSLQNEGIADTNSGLLTLRYSGEVCAG